MVIGESHGKNRQVQELLFKRLQRRPGQSMAKRVNVCEKAVLDRKAEKLNVELKSVETSLTGKSHLTHWGPLAAFNEERRSTISQSQSSFKKKKPPEQKLGRATNRGSRRAIGELHCP